MAGKDAQPPRVDADGKPMKFKARRPFHFPVEGDRGEAANVDRPVLAAGPKARPAYPENLATQDVMGGAIMALVIRADGSVRSVTAVRASHPEFAAAAETALKQWSFVPRDGPACRWNRRGTWRSVFRRTDMRST
ncbi:MAG: energy transducer TonB [Lacunisphaera sp.]